ncbi:hypothetical protein [Polymorphospora rubra]|uniref:Uncharacterized protein n=1 Tax=Polymorphospora rubra TaxID=338584 RepID=A0A810NFT9_9ACTN|nr:hypothetical protein [Polymorphospora rubra]BCJ70313.1 hypothetical protein Prubr_73340 [Polymorphospora rubra]
MTGRRARTVRRSRLATLVLGLLALAPLLAVPPAAGPAQGQDGAESAVTVNGRADGHEDFSGLRVTVSQTRDLTNQAVLVTWTGAEPTPRNRPVGVDYLQLMQCWGDPQAPGDPLGLAFRETCQFGLGLPQPAMAQGSDAPAGKNASRRRLDEIAGYPHPDPTETLPAAAQMVPFRSVDGGRTPDGSPQQPFGTKPNPNVPGGTMDQTDDDVLRAYFDEASTNEYPYALSAADGTGRVAFEVQNAARAPHLGCGAPAGAGPRRCHLVVVPRGSHDPYGGQDVATAGAVHGSPFSPAVWRHRIVVPLDFRAVGSACSLTQAERRTAGTELVAEAITSWQPALCAGSGPVIGYSAIGDFEAQNQVLSPSSGAPGLVFSAAPVAGTDPPLVHAPVAASGVVVAFNVDGNLDPYATAAEQERLRGAVLSELRLTPRLVAKLLTQSYRRDVPGIGGPTDNPNSIKYDKEFLDLNPVFRFWDQTPSATLNGLMTPVGNSMATRELWRWVLADPTARDWLAGSPDSQGPGKPGMVVNPAYQQLFAAGAVDYFPKADQSCAKESFQDVEYTNCTLDYRPYAGSLGEAALQTLRADSKGTAVPLQTINLPAGEQPRWTRIPRQEPGFRLAMSVTDSASAARYGLHTAQLCAAAPDATGTYVATDCRSATTAQMTAALGAMTPTDVPGVLAVDPAKVRAAAGAYPLTMVTYAIGNTAAPADDRRDYATLLRHAAGPGQIPGVAPGTLPEGYVPLPQAMREQTRTAADTLERATAPTTPPAADDPPAAPPGPVAGGAPTGVPVTPAPPSPGPVASSPVPTALPVAGTTTGSAVGILRFVLIGALVVGLFGGVAGPVLRRLAVRVPRDRP